MTATVDGPAVTGPVVAALHPADRRPYAELLVDAFLEQPRDDVLDAWEDISGAGTFLAAHDGDRIVGGAGALHRRWTVPGPRSAPVAAVTGVAVAPDARGRGALRALLDHQLRDAHEHGGEPVAALWASQGALYGRFGYEVASRRADLVVPTGATLRAGLPDPGGVRTVTEEAGPLLREVHARAAGRVGWMSRSEASWSWWLGEPAAHGGPQGRLWRVVREDPDGRPDGYALFRIDRREPAGSAVDVLELVADAPDAELALWRHLLGLDLVERVRHRLAAVDHPLPRWLEDPRRATLSLADALWVRLVDVDRALASRALAASADLVVEVADTACPWNAGPWHVEGAAGETPAVRRARPGGADLSCDVTVLAAAYLGDTTVTQLARAGRVREHRPGAVAALSDALAAREAPHTPDVF